MKKEQEILDAVNIEEVVSKYVELKKRGVNFIGLCPFHSEKTPSFVISPSKKIYKCFGCGKGGNVISFIQDLKKVSFEKAIKIISDDANLEIKGSIDNGSNRGIYIEDSMDSKVFNRIKDNFQSNIKSVKDLMNFDNIILDFCISHIETLDEKIRNNNELKLTSVAFFPTTTLKQLKQIKENNSFRDMYESIFNQCLVLLVSYFTTAVKELFSSSLQYFAEYNTEHFESIKTDIKFNIEELSNYNFNLSKSIGELIIKKNNISFQDMKSICREFKLYLGFDIDKNSDIDNIIFSQASRHSIVHALSIADAKFINQIKNTNQRTLKLEIKLNDGIIFSPSEIETIIESMNNFMQLLINQIQIKFEK